MSMAWLNWLYPRKCVFCKTLMPREMKGNICNTCIEDLSFCVERATCKRCDKPVEEGEPLCPFCRVQKKVVYRKLMAVCLYREPAKQSLLRFKHERYKAYAKAYAPLMASVLQYRCGQVVFDGVVAVPPRKRRMRQRGYDQAACLAKALAKELKLPYLGGVLKQEKGVARQSSLPRGKRFQNMKGKIKPRKQVSGTVLLVDDICTTRATMLAGAEALKEAGAKMVYGITFATTP